MASSDSTPFGRSRPRRRPTFNACLTPTAWGATVSIAARGSARPAMIMAQKFVTFLL